MFIYPRACGLTKQRLLPPAKNNPFSVDDDSDEDFVICYLQDRISTRQ